MSHTLHWHEPPVSGCQGGLKITLHRHFSRTLEQASVLDGGRSRNADSTADVGIKKDNKRNPEGIRVDKTSDIIDDEVVHAEDDEDDDDDEDGSDVLYAISKPATVPSHAGGVYLASSLLTMVYLVISWQLLHIFLSKCTLNVLLLKVTLKLD